MPILVTGTPCASCVRRRFEGVRECEGMVHDDPSPQTSGRALLQASDVPCLAVAKFTRGDRCVTCHRLVSFFPSPDRTRVIVRCSWTDRDPIADLMTPVARLTTIPADARAADAARVATDPAPELVLVLDGEMLTAVVHRDELAQAAPDLPVSALPRRRSWLVDPQTTLGEAAAILGDGADCVLVVEGGMLQGMLTRRHLREIGWEPGP